MVVKHLLEHLEVVKVTGKLPEEITGIAMDSRKVQPGHLFFAIKGERFDGHRFVDEARKNGAVLFVVEEETGIQPEIVVPDTRIALARVSDAFYGHPSRKLKVVGITGTNGKTTTAHLLRSILGDALCISTTGYYSGDEIHPALNTTPDPITIHSLMKRSLEKGIRYAVLEVSSHSIVQRRVDAIDFDYGIFTCLSRDHLDYHGNMDAYMEAKGRFFEGLKRDGFAVINHDDPAAEYMIEKTTAKVITYGLTGGNVSGEIIRSNGEGLILKVHGLGKTFTLKSSLSGRFNALNILAGVATSLLMGIDDERIVKGVEGFKGVEGRLQPVDCGQPFRVYVDYAHTPDAMANVLSAIREFTSGRIIAVFGAGGNRDKGKRPLMGRVASKLADSIIITSDNPRDEDPVSIMEDIASGVDSENYRMVVDRKEAIRQAIALAKEGDTVVIMGKGHEGYQEVRGMRILFSDLKTAMEVLREYGFDCG